MRVAFEISRDFFGSRFTQTNCACQRGHSASALNSGKSRWIGRPENKIESNIPTHTWNENRLYNWDMGPIQTSHSYSLRNSKWLRTEWIDLTDVRTFSAQPLSPTVKSTRNNMHTIASIPRTPGVASWLRTRQRGMR